MSSKTFTKKQFSRFWKTLTRKYVLINCCYFFFFFFFMQVLTFLVVQLNPGIINWKEISWKHCISKQIHSKILTSLNLWENFDLNVHEFIVKIRSQDWLRYYQTRKVHDFMHMLFWFLLVCKVVLATLSIEKPSHTYKAFTNGKK